MGKHDKHDKAPTFQHVISNPPYQRTVGVNYSDAIYHEFMKAGQYMGETVSMIYPSRWTQGGVGAGLTAFRDEELRSYNYISYDWISDDSSIFPTVHTEGLNTFVWSRIKETPGIRYTFDGVLEYRDTLLNRLGMFVGHPRDTSILRGMGHAESTLDQVAHTRGYHGKLTHGAPIIKVYDKPTDGRDTVDVRYLDTTEHPITTKWRKMLKTDITGSTDYYSALTSKTAGGDPLRRPDRMTILHPGQAHSVSFWRIGMYDTHEEATNMVRYIKTDLATYLMGIVTPNHNFVAIRLSLVPLVDAATGQIDGTDHVMDFGSPETLDDQLADIYKLTDDDREWIRSRIRPWNDKLDPYADEGL